MQTCLRLIGRNKIVYNYDMRNFHRTSLLLFLNIALLSICAQEEAFVPFFSVDIMTESFPAKGGRKTISLTYNISWRASSNKDWPSVSPTSRKEGAILLNDLVNRNNNSFHWEESW